MIHRVVSVNYLFRGGKIKLFQLLPGISVFPLPFSPYLLSNFPLSYTIVIISVYHVSTSFRLYLKHQKSTSLKSPHFHFPSLSCSPTR